MKHIRRNKRRDDLCTISVKWKDKKSGKKIRYEAELTRLQVNFLENWLIYDRFSKKYPDLLAIGVLSISRLMSEEKRENLIANLLEEKLRENSFWLKDFIEETNCINNAYDLDYFIN